MAAEDYGILISTPGISVTNAQKNQILMNTRNPFFKIDTQNKAGLQTMLLLIVTDPPEPAVGNENWTVVAQYRHNYTYPPMVETLYFMVTPPAGAPFFQQYALSSTSPTGIIVAAQDPGDFVFLYAVADAVNVYYIIHRQLFIGTPTILTGTTLQITTHVYVEDVPLV
jgi:hypothetical protein